MALAAERTRVVVYDRQPKVWDTVVAVRDKLGWPTNHFEVHCLPSHNESSSEPN